MADPENVYETRVGPVWAEQLEGDRLNAEFDLGERFCRVEGFTEEELDALLLFFFKHEVPRYPRRRCHEF